MTRRSTNFGESRDRFKILDQSKDKAIYRNGSGGIRAGTDQSTRLRPSGLPPVSKSLAHVTGRLHNNSKVMRNRAEAQKIADQMMEETERS